MGIIIPSIHIKDNLELQPCDYMIKVNGEEVGKGVLVVEHLLAMDPGNILDEVEGIKTTEPVFDLPACGQAPAGRKCKLDLLWAAYCSAKPLSGLTARERHWLFLSR